MGRHGAGLKELRIWKTPAVVPPPPPVPTPSQINWVTGRRLHVLDSIKVAGVVNGRLTPIWQNSGQRCLIAAPLPPDGVANVVRRRRPLGAGCAGRVFLFWRALTCSLTYALTCLLCVMHTPCMRTRT